jgi:hypothetical protein
MSCGTPWNMLQHNNMPELDCAGITEHIAAFFYLAFGHSRWPVIFRRMRNSVFPAVM